MWYRLGIIGRSVQQWSSIWKNLDKLARCSLAVAQLRELAVLFFLTMKALMFQDCKSITTFESGIVPISCWATFSFHYSTSYHPTTLQTAFGHLTNLEIRLGQTGITVSTSLTRKISLRHSASVTVSQTIGGGSMLHVRQSPVDDIFLDSDLLMGLELPSARSDLHDRSLP